MSADNRTPANLQLEISPAALKKIVEEGNLVEFTTKFPALVAGHVAEQIVEQIAQAASQKGAFSKGLSIKVGLDIDGGYGNGPHWPHPHGGIDSVIGKISSARQETLVNA